MMPSIRRVARSVSRLLGRGVPVRLSRDYGKTTFDNPSPSMLGRAEEFKEVAKEVLAPGLSASEVVIHSFRRQSESFQEPVLDGAFHIWIWGVGRRDSSFRYSSPEHAWGLSTSTQFLMHSPSGLGGSVGGEESIPIKTDEGDVVAEVVGDKNLYIFLALNDPHFNNGVEIFSRILEEAHIVVEPNPLKAQRLYRSAGSLRVDSQERFALLITGGTEGELSSTLEGGAAISQEVLSHTRVIASSLEGRDAGEVRLAALEQLATNYQKEAEDKLALVREHPKVEEVAIRGNLLVVYTSVLVAHNERTENLHTIGAFRIEFDLVKGSVRWFNLTNPTSDRQAPQVYADGSPVVDETIGAFPALLAEFDLALAVELAINFVETVDPDSYAGRLLEGWPVTTEPQPLSQSS